MSTIPFIYGDYTPHLNRIKESAAQSKIEIGALRTTYNPGLVARIQKIAYSAILTGPLLHPESYAEKKFRAGMYEGLLRKFIKDIRESGENMETPIIVYGLFDFKRHDPRKYIHAGATHAIDISEQTPSQLVATIKEILG